MAVSGIGSVGGNDGLEEFKKAQMEVVSKARTEATAAKQAGPADGATPKAAASSVEGAQGGNAPKYPQI